MRQHILNLHLHPSSGSHLPIPNRRRAYGRECSVRSTSRVPISRSAVTFLRLFQEMPSHCHSAWSPSHPAAGFASWISSLASHPPLLPALPPSFFPYSVFVLLSEHFCWVSHGCSRVVLIPGRSLSPRLSSHIHRFDSCFRQRP